jgi:hypothetical protein
MGKYKDQKRFTEEEIKDIANKLGVVVTTIKKRQFRPGFFQWVEDALWLASKGYPIRMRVYRKGSEKLVTRMVSEALEVSNSSAEKRLGMWEEGLLETDEVFTSGEVFYTEEKANWDGLTSKDRSCNLSRMKKFVKDVY